MYDGRESIRPIDDQHYLEEISFPKETNRG